MTGAIAATMFWLGGYWNSITPNFPNTFVLDAFGTQITVGATVKLIGVVTALNALDGHFNEVQMTLKFPAGKKISPIQTGAFSGTQLVVGT